MVKKNNIVKNSDKNPGKKKELQESQVDSDASKSEKYYEAVGRRKTAIARVRLYTKKASDTVPEEGGLITVNNLFYVDYFPDSKQRRIIETPLRKLKSLGRLKAMVRVRGGGKGGQAEAIRHGLSRALILFDVNFRNKLKKAGFLTRDARKKERKKYGLKKARKSPQWAKR